MRGYMGIGVYCPKTEENIGTLWRSAYLFGASFIFTIGRRYKKQPSDTVKAHDQIPLWNFQSYEEFKEKLPYGARLVCVELAENSKPLPNFAHPKTAVYLLGAEDHGIPKAITDKELTVQIPAQKTFSMNVATAGSIVLYDRFIKA